MAKANKVAEVVGLNVVGVLASYIPKGAKRFDMVNVNVSVIGLLAAQLAGVVVALARRASLRFPVVAAPAIVCAAAPKRGFATVSGNAVVAAHALVATKHRALCAAGRPEDFRSARKTAIGLLAVSRVLVSRHMGGSPLRIALAAAKRVLDNTSITLTYPKALSARGTRDGHARLVIMMARSADPVYLDRRLSLMRATLFGPVTRVRPRVINAARTRTELRRVILSVLGYKLAAAMGA